ncbi:MAG TPA: GNAT family N-acetyltransferase [Polyangiaceae bacterium]|nr:GNAT family N-acetyltransferase [Polyangiaceae bacterium]
MSDAVELEVGAVRAADAPAVLAFFAQNACGCHCRYWHFEGDKNAWLHRLAHEPEQNAGELEHSLRSSDGTPQAVVARSPEGVVGWMKLSPAEAVQKLYAQRIYKGLPCFDGDRGGVLTIGCFLVDEHWRRQGVARALLRAGVRIAQQSGARAVEAFPRRGEHLGDPEMWLGPASLFEQEGFDVVNEFGPYPVLRRTF